MVSRYASSYNRTERAGLIRRIPVSFSRANTPPEAYLRYRYSRFHRTAELSAIAAFAILAAALGWRVGATLDGLAECIVFAASLPTGYILADLISGVVHWLADRYGTETTPVLGANFIRPFREHHIDPKAIASHDFIETNGSNCIMSAPFLGLAFFLLPIEASLVTTFLHGGTLAFCLAIFATNQFHKWAHMDTPPRFVRSLRKFALVLTPEHHDIHHSAPFDRNYCITSGWWNPFLERVKLFQRAENGLAFLTGRRPAETPSVSRQPKSCSMARLQFDQD
jgi:plasmanylethanolamine desaturase